MKFYLVSSEQPALTSLAHREKQWQASATLQWWKPHVTTACPMSSLSIPAVAPRPGAGPAQRPPAHTSPTPQDSWPQSPQADSYFKRQVMEHGSWAVEDTRHRTSQPVCTLGCPCSALSG